MWRALAQRGWRASFLHAAAATAAREMPHHARAPRALLVLSRAAASHAAASPASSQQHSSPHHHHSQTHPSKHVDRESSHQITLKPRTEFLQALRSTSSKQSVLPPFSEESVDAAIDIWTNREVTAELKKSACDDASSVAVSCVGALQLELASKIAAHVRLDAGANAVVVQALLDAGLAEEALMLRHAILGNGGSIPTRTMDSLCSAAIALGRTADATQLLYGITQRHGKVSVATYIQAIKAYMDGTLVDPTFKASAERKSTVFPKEVYKLLQQLAADHGPSLPSEVYLVFLDQTSTFHEVDALFQDMHQSRLRSSEVADATLRAYLRTTQALPDDKQAALVPWATSLLSASFKQRLALGTETLQGLLARFQSLGETAASVQAYKYLRSDLGASSAPQGTITALLTYLSSAVDGTQTPSFIDFIHTLWLDVEESFNQAVPQDIHNQFLALASKTGHSASMKVAFERIEKAFPASIPDAALVVMKACVTHSLLDDLLSYSRHVGVANFSNAHVSALLSYVRNLRTLPTLATVMAECGHHAAVQRELFEVAVRVSDSLLAKNPMALVPVPLAKVRVTGSVEAFIAQWQPAREFLFSVVHDGELHRFVLRRTSVLGLVSVVDGEQQQEVSDVSELAAQVDGTSDMTQLCESLGCTVHPKGSKKQSYKLF